MVYQCLLGMADNKSQRRHLTTQHTTRPVATPRPPSTTPPRLHIIVPQLMLSELLHRSPEVLFFPELHYQRFDTTPMLRGTAPPRHRCTAPPRHRSTALLHIMGKYSVAWSFNMPTTNTHYLLSSRMKGEKRWKNSAAEWAFPLQQQELPCTICHQLHSSWR
jgi:hypothetical protein